MLKQSKSLLSICMFSLACASAQAANVTGSSSGIWTSPTPGATVSGVGTNTLLNGQAVVNVADQLTFTGTNFSSDFNTSFKLGTLDYYNSAVLNSATSVHLNLTLAFTNPAIPNVLNDFLVNFVFTSNLGDPVGDADYAFLPSAFSPTLFTIGGINYQVQIDGFQNVIGDGFLASDPLQLHVMENHGASADLYGRVVMSQIQTDVPEPGSLALIVAALGAATLAARRRRKS